MKDLNEKCSYWNIIQCQLAMWNWPPPIPSPGAVMRWETYTQIPDRFWWWEPPLFTYYELLLFFCIHSSEIATDLTQTRNSIVGKAMGFRMFASHRYIPATSVRRYFSRVFSTHRHRPLLHCRPAGRSWKSKKKILNKPVHPLEPF